MLYILPIAVREIGGEIFCLFLVARWFLFILVTFC